MNLFNATLSSVQHRSGASAAGKLLYADTVPMTVRCALGDVTEQQARQLGATIASATAVVYVLKSRLASAGAGVTIEDGDKLIVTIDEGSAKTYEAVKAFDRQKSGGLAHFECFCQEVTA